MHSQDSAGGFGPPGRGFESLRALLIDFIFRYRVLNLKQYADTRTMKIRSSFRIGIILIIIASIWISIVFSGSEKISYSTNLESKESVNLELDLAKNGIGFYTITILHYSKHVLFVQILDSNGNVIADKKIATKMSVNYFEFSHEGRYIIEITNFSEKPVEIQAYFGNTKVSELLTPVFVSFFGAGFIIFSGYKKLSNHSTAQPEENAT